MHPNEEQREGRKKPPRAKERHGEVEEDLRKEETIYESFRGVKLGEQREDSQRAGRK